jgi:hypothetical protein
MLVQWTCSDIKKSDKGLAYYQESTVISLSHYLCVAVMSSCLFSTPQSVLTQPKIVGELGGKIPANVRQSYLNHLVAEYLKLYPDPSDAHSKVSIISAVASMKYPHDERPTHFS